ncbi:hypothetical protein SDC9_118453 [bioreactor metagenome]|uniref:Uncharacterized protein n=1 Tax=bioreactor metagenome TaxID=1076179 RepID=A0A645C2A8_9ZZZZ
MEFGHGFQIGRILFAVENSLYTSFQLIGDFFHALRAVLPGQHKGLDWLRGLRR